MTPFSGRTALDLLDAHLEDLRDGADLPLLPDGLDGHAVDEAGDPVHRALDRLKGFSRQPGDVFTQEVGGGVPHAAVPLERGGRPAARRPVRLRGHRASLARVLGARRAGGTAPLGP